jgi:putative resolvase
MLRDWSLGAVFGVYRDRASGLRGSRAALNGLLDDAGQGRFSVVWRDRLTRLGWPGLNAMSVCAVSVEALPDHGDESLVEELMDDFMALLASFSGRFYRLGSARNQQRLRAAASARLAERVGENTVSC